MDQGAWSGCDACSRVGAIWNGWPARPRDSRPRAGNGDALIRRRAAALNQVDLYMREGGKGIRHQLPMILGVEGVGEVVTAPEGSGLEPAQRVALYPATFCGHCRDCLRGEQPFCERVRYLGEHRDGTFAELVALPAACLRADRKRFG